MAFNLKDDPRMQQRLQGAVGLLSTKDIDAPPAELPPLDEIVVEVKAPSPPSEVEILERYRAKLRELAVVTPLKRAADTLLFGDEVCISTVGHHNGALVAGSIRHEHWTELIPDASVVGFAEQLVGLAVGASTVIPVVLEDGRPATFAVRILDAQRVRMPDLEDPKSLGIAPTLEATLEIVGKEIQAQAEEASPIAAMQAAMQKLAALAKVDVADSAVDAEIQRAWRAAEGDACLALGLTVEEQQEALKLWLADAAVREEATKRLKAWAALKTVAARDNLELNEQGWTRFFFAFAPALGQTPQFLRDEVEKDPKTKSELEELAFRMQVVDHVLERLTIRVVE